MEYTAVHHLCTSRTVASECQSPWEGGVGKLSLRIGSHLGISEVGGRPRRRTEATMR